MYRMLWVMGDISKLQRLHTHYTVHSQYMYNCISATTAQTDPRNWMKWWSNATGPLVGMYSVYRAPTIPVIQMKEQIPSCHSFTHCFVCNPTHLGYFYLITLSISISKNLQDFPDPQNFGQYHFFLFSLIFYSFPAILLLPLMG